MLEIGTATLLGNGTGMGGGYYLHVFNRYANLQTFHLEKIKNPSHLSKCSEKVLGSAKFG
jgi:hypothetical protein